MGYYINTTPAGQPLPAHGKADELLAAGAEQQTSKLQMKKQNLCITTLRYIAFGMDSAIMANITKGLFDNEN